MKLLRIAALLGAVGWVAPGPARAEPPPRPASAQDADSRKVLRPGEVEITGKVRKPTAPSLTPPSVALDPRPERRDSFLRKIVEAVDKEPFP